MKDDWYWVATLIDILVEWINVNALRKGYLAEHFKEGSLIDLAFTMSIDDWQGRKSLTLTTVDIKPHVK